ncbi:MAG: glycosyltransferase family 2 protein [Clostridia bacterium]|nr:glycosyltransferase family 2 protein [Clostridia bacterium]
MKTMAIVTPTYNRGHLLKNVFDSLNKQTNKDFVWYIIDDGSADNTQEMVDELKQQTDIEIIYKYKDNGGKHTAINMALDIVAEELTLILDSDDQLLPNAVEVIMNDYVDIKQDNQICGLGYLKCHTNMNIVGKQYTQDVIVDTFTNQRINHNTYGDKCEIFKTEIFKKFRFPEFKDERFVSESAIWCKMSLEYKMKFFNKPIYMCEYLEGGLSDNVKRRLFKNPKGAVECYLMMSSKQAKFKPRFKYTIAYTVYSFAAKAKIKQQFKRVHSKFIYIATFIPAWIIYLTKKHKFKDKK